MSLSDRITNCQKIEKLYVVFIYKKERVYTNGR